LSGCRAREGGVRPNFQLPLSGSPMAMITMTEVSERITPFNSLSRDHPRGSTETRPPR